MLNPRLQLPDPFRTSALLCLLVLFGLSLPTWATDIQVFTDRQHPVKTPHPEIRIIELDAATHLEAEISARLPSDPTRAATIVQQRLREGGPHLQQRMAVAYQGIADAWGMGISKLPAVVVDQHYVVYGENDVERALARIQAYRGKQP